MNNAQLIQEQIQNEQQIYNKLAVQNRNDAIAHFTLQRILRSINKLKRIQEKCKHD